MIPRSHAHKPVSHDRGPESKEDTQTNFDALNVLGNIPAPTTAIDACLDSGFHLNNGVKLTNGDGLLLVGGEAFAWRPWKAVEGAESDRVAKDAMLNAKRQFELDESVWGLLNLVWPKPGTLALAFYFFGPGYELSSMDMTYLTATSHFDLLTVLPQICSFLVLVARISSSHLKLSDTSTRWAFGWMSSIPGMRPRSLICLLRSVVLLRLLLP